MNMICLHYRNADGRVYHCYEKNVIVALDFARMFGGETVKFLYFAGRHIGYVITLN